MPCGSQEKITNSKGDGEEGIILVNSSTIMPSFEGLIFPLIPINLSVFFVEQRFLSG